MRHSFIVLAGMLALALTLTACGDSKKEAAGEPSATVTPTQITVGQVLVGTEDLPAGCTLQIEGSQYVNYYSRSFECGEVRLTNDVGLLKSVDDARTWMSNGWGTKDGALDVIKGAISARPADPASLKVDDVTQSLPKIGAEEERLYCSSYTDPSGTQIVTQYWGALRYKSSVVQYSAVALTKGACDHSTRLPEMARTLATAQLNKLRAAVR